MCAGSDMFLIIFSTSFSSYYYFDLLRAGMYMQRRVWLFILLLVLSLAFAVGLSLREIAEKSIKFF